MKAAPLQKNKTMHNLSKEEGTAEKLILCLFISIGSITVLSGESGTIENPKTVNYNVHTNWKIKVATGKRIKLFLMFHRFEFQENCPYDYIEVRDGGDGQSRLMGKFCRNPSQVFLESMSNQLFITYHADNSYESLFKLFYLSQDDTAGKEIPQKVYIFQFLNTRVPEFLARKYMR